MSKATLVNGRIVGGYSLFDSVKTDTRCRDGIWPNEHVGPWRCVDCCELAGQDRDIVECAQCGEQRNVGCTFDDGLRMTALIAGAGFARAAWELAQRRVVGNYYSDTRPLPRRKAGLGTCAHEYYRILDRATHLWRIVPLGSTVHL